VIVTTSPKASMTQDINAVLVDFRRHYFDSVPFLPYTQTESFGIRNSTLSCLRCC